MLRLVGAIMMFALLTGCATDSTGKGKGAESSINWGQVIGNALIEGSKGLGNARQNMRQPTSTFCSGYGYTVRCSSY